MSNFKNKFLVGILLSLGSCGTIIGNGINDPDPLNPPSNEEFLKILKEYKDNTSEDCGNYSQDSTLGQIENGRQCIIDADTTCTPSKYLMDRINSNGSRFTSLVTIFFVDPFSPCKIRVRTLSNDPNNIIDANNTCGAFIEGQIPEEACGVAPIANIAPPPPSEQN